MQGVVAIFFSGVLPLHDEIGMLETRGGTLKNTGVHSCGVNHLEQTAQGLHDPPPQI
jgi:hypothetical protein